ncbi:MAG: hypothetical protein Q9168_003442 [Polycauliona sp. 1 TL-2023]
MSRSLTMLAKGLLLVTLLPAALADVQFTSPAAGGTIAAGKPITAQWKDSGDGTALTDLSTYTLFLCAGGNDQASFIQSVGAKGAQVINYSDRFTLSGMTGTFPPAVAAGIKAVSGTAGPPSSNQEAPAAGGAEGGDVMSYAAQTGLIKYAPMLIQPGTKITKKTPSPRYPTSSVAIAQTFLPTPKQTTTMTASNTNAPAQSHAFQVSEAQATARQDTFLIEIQAPAAAMPQDDMQKFLHRWRD